MDKVTDYEEAVATHGFLGYDADPTPNENYSVKGGPTPETDEDAKAAALANSAAIRADLNAGPGERPEPEPARKGGSSGASSAGGSSGGSAKAT